ncbi:PAS domain S-box protein [Aerosakkonema funiforme]|uniref:histidine kinase n=3 Tax=Oscillatoriophycideae TaxID=1301283 RepID=A0A926VDN4_9CYAN|nr:PAS domain S-box protein [Aerosakkonema funiforme]MBD2181795.1 PAS domain S-box protein [Aerosakkonema funiforme FACHB-1375]
MTSVVADSISQGNNNLCMEIEGLNNLRQYRLDDATSKPRSQILLAAEIQPQAEEEMNFQALILDSTPHAIITTDTEGKITYWNRYAENLYQWQAAEVIGKDFYELTVAQISSQQIAAISDTVAQQNEWTGKFSVHRKDGTQFWADVKYSALKESNGNLTGFLQVSIPSNNSTLFQDRSPQSESTVQILSDAIPDAIFRVYKDTTFLECKPPKGFSLELPVSQFLGKKIGEILPKNMADRAKKQIRKALANNQTEIFEYQLQTEGKLRDFEARIVPTSSDEVAIFVRDITERKQAERDLAKSEERYRIVSELTSDFAYAAKIDSNGLFVTDWITSAFSFMSGFSWEEIEARGGWQNLIHQEDMPIFLERLQKILCWQTDVSEYRLFTKNGELRWLRDYSQPVYCDDRNRVLLIYGGVQDITDRKQAEEALGQQTEREKLLGMMQERIRQSLDLDEILNQAVAEVRSFLQVERVAIYQIDERNFGKFVVESIAENCSSILGVSCEDPCFNENYIQKYQQGYISAIDDIEQANLAPCHIELLAQIGIRANLLVPIVFNKKLWGLLCAHQCSEPRHWQPFEIDLLQQLAITVALAIQQSSLFKQIQKLNGELEQQVQERTAELKKAIDFEAMLKRITDKVRDSLDENQILETAVREVAVGLNIGSCNAAIYDLEKGITTVCHEYAVSIPAQQGRVAHMANYPEIYTQLLEKQYFQFCSIFPNPVRGRVAMLACPIFDNEGLLGDLWLINHKEHSYSELEIRLVQQVANQCAIAIRQARLYQAAQAQVAELEKLNQLKQEQLVELEKLNHLKQEQVAELEKLNLLKDDFLSTVSHELRTPMANMKMAIQMLKIVPSGERHQRYLEILKTECDRETELINDLLDLQRLEASSYPLSLAESLNLQEWLPNIIEPFRSRTLERGQNLQIELPADVPPLVSDRAGLARIVAELLNNACKYTPPGGGIILRVSHHLAGEDVSLQESTSCSCVPKIVLAVSNEVEIPPAELSHVFKKFYRVLQADLWKQGGTGLGLALVQKLVEQMGGTINVKSGDGWTTFRIELPNR